MVRLDGPAPSACLTSHPAPDGREPCSRLDLFVRRPPRRVARGGLMGAGHRVVRGCRLCALLVAAAPTVARAQPGAPVRCDGRIVRSVQIAPQSPFVGGMLQRWEIIGRAVQALHVTTEAEVVERFLLLEEGQPCTELRRAESERILRAQPYLASATVQTLADDADGVVVRVSTVDEITLVASLRTRGAALRGGRIGEDNLLGKGMAVEAEWFAGRYGEAAFGGRFADYQMFSRPYQFEVEARRLELGEYWNASLTNPFLTDLQRLAWRTSGGFDKAFTQFQRGAGLDRLALPTQRQYVSVGAVVRLGIPGRLSMFGAALTSERQTTAGIPIVVNDSGLFELPSADPLLSRYPATATARANALWGVRNLSFLRVQGFDALSGVQDVREGFQLGTLVGRSLSALGARDDDLFVAAELYSGFGTPRSFLMTELRGEARENFDNNQWDGILGHGRATWYGRPHDKHTVVATAEWTGGWRMRVPYQVSLGDRDGGMRGFRNSRLGGARRAVVRLEERYRMGRYNNNGEYGVAAFAEAGRLWAGDVPFGTDLSPQASAGISLLAGFPVGSQRLWRVDLAFPLTDGGDGRFELRLTSFNSLRRPDAEPEDVRRSRERAIEPAVYTWP